MRILLFFWFSVFCSLVSAQQRLPVFLAGTWKIENKNQFEHWDILNENSMKGFAYQIVNGDKQVIEYLEINQVKKNLVYSASVIKQNGGKSIPFKLLHIDTVFVFENLKHDFPKRILYKKLDDTSLFVEVSDGKSKGYSYRLYRENFKTKSADYDEKLAMEYGADDYGMKSYFLVMLKTGKNTTDDKDFISKSFRGHMDNIGRLVKEKKLVVAGPLGKNEKDYRGIFILYNVSSVEEAQAILMTDPAIKSELLEYELYNWYGSAALEAYLPLAEKIAKIKP
jgi:uncharacterized protein YciI